MMKKICYSANLSTRALIYQRLPKLRRSPLTRRHDEKEIANLLTSLHLHYRHQLHSSTLGRHIRTLTFLSCDSKMKMLMILKETSMLQELNIIKVKQVSPETIQHIRHFCPHIRRLSLCHLDFSDRAMIILSEHYTKLTDLTLHGCNRLTSFALFLLRDCPLTSFTLKDCKWLSLVIPRNSRRESRWHLSYHILSDEVSGRLTVSEELNSGLLQSYLVDATKYGGGTIKEIGNQMRKLDEKKNDIHDDRHDSKDERQLQVDIIVKLMTADTRLLGYFPYLTQFTSRDKILDEGDLIRLIQRHRHLTTLRLDVQSITKTTSLLQTSHRMSNKEATLKQKLQESKVLAAELTYLRPTAKLYQRKVPTSNIFFLETDINTIKSDAKYQQKILEKEVKALSS
ncbi:hypothetical protein BC941DRAFT_514683 [Chlamydoabsidia padenii]|nr:hypothetical protein BC941DRAFT_514683 [Chlamydoabsidia padenii]